VELPKFSHDPFVDPYDALSDEELEEVMLKTWAPATTDVTVTITPYSLGRVKKLAKMDKRPVGWMLRFLLERAIDSEAEAKLSPEELAKLAPPNPYPA